MRRFAFLALAVMLAASAAFAGQSSVGAQPTAIQVVATSGNSYQVSAAFNSDEIPVSFSVATPASGPTATVTSLTLISCSHYFLGDCTSWVPDTDASATAYSSGIALANVDASNSNEGVSFVVNVVLNCTTQASVVVVANQGGLTLSAPVTCGGYFTGAPYYPGYNPGYGYPVNGCGTYPYGYAGYNGYAGQPYGAPYGYAGYNNNYYTSTNLYGGCAFIYQDPNPSAYITAPVAVIPGTNILATNRSRNLGAALAAVNGASGTKRNLAYHAQQQAAVRQIAAAQAAAAAAAAAGSVSPPRAGEAGWVTFDENATYPVITFYDEVPEEQASVLALEEGEE